jgi:hypothetical protein
VTQHHDSVRHLCDIRKFTSFWWRNDKNMYRIFTHFMPKQQLLSNQSDKTPIHQIRVSQLFKTHSRPLLSAIFQPLT